MTYPDKVWTAEERAEIIAHHSRVMNDLARLSGSLITIFDHSLGRHVFASDNFISKFGADKDPADVHGIAHIDDSVHPDDIGPLESYRSKVPKLIVERQELSDFKIAMEFRVMDRDNKYVRVIEQLSPLEANRDGSMWLSLSILDISPDQSLLEGFRCQIINFNTGEYFTFEEFTGEESPVKLTKREAEILSMVKAGMPSKHISEKLFISVHTVNTHRQRILEKLKAGNSFEAIRQAEKMRGK